MAPIRLLPILTLLAGAEPLPERVEFNRDVRPILSDNCFQCHGPDRNQRKADLRLDTEAGLASAITVGKADQSELIQRVTSVDAKEHMPPAKTGKKLTTRDITLLKRWIDQGAKWQPHWAFVPAKRPPLPDVADRRWPRNGIDYFVLSRLERERLRPLDEANRITLLRRVTLDLTGLPPTPEEVDRAQNDQSPDWYERVVDRLLASPRYGERMAIRWLDAARYADTSGYQSDGERSMWRWRDWVIDAFNCNMPFDRFTVEQLAGDLLPTPTLDQRIATGFNRNHRGNGEGGIIPEEYAVEYVADRVETTATVWLGLTLGCTRCHDHKFDPFSQKEFYQLFAFFNNVPEQGRAIKYGNSPPYIKAPTLSQQAELAAAEKRLAEAVARCAELEPRLAKEQERIEKAFRSGTHRWTVTDGLAARFALDRQAKDVAVKDGESAFDDRAATFDGRRFLDAGNIGDFGFYDKFSLVLRVFADGRNGGALVSRTPEIPQADGYSVRLENGKVQVQFTKRWLDDALRVETVRPLEPGRWYHVLVTYDGSRVAAGVRVYVDGVEEKVTVLLDELNQSFITKEPFRIGSGGGPTTRFHGRIADVRIYNRTLGPDEAALFGASDSLSEVARIDRDKRTPAQAAKLRAAVIEKYAPAEIRAAHRRVVELRRECERLVESTPTVMVMEEMPTPRDSFVLLRGQYDKRGEKVTSEVPAILPRLPVRTDGRRPNRLDLARWLVHPDHPLTARVAVNRAWQMFFGAGLVKTTEDFGSQGELPTHPELLDWLARKFVDSGWDVKRLHRLIVLSATYRQSSASTPQQRQRDPDNRLLARGPRLRLSAEMIRDQALFAGGLLVERLGGPSVKPYQPPGLIRELTGTEDYEQGHGADLYRRGLYTFWKRTVAPPVLVTFDASGRETCSVRDTRTNTPLQALALLNDVTFVEASRALAQRTMREGGATVNDRLTLLFRLPLSRSPTAAELRVLRAGFDRHLDFYRRDPKAAAKLIQAGASRPDTGLDVAELAAYTATASLILNLDEAITRE
jgi:hypothetical protein